MKNKTSITHLTRLCLCALLAGVYSLSFGQKIQFINMDSLPKPEFQLILHAPYTCYSDTIKQIYEPKYLTIQGDTVKAVLYILKQLQTKSEALYAAEEVLQYLTTNGQVTNWKKFYKAVKKYQAVQNYQAVILNAR
jgi:hypothetical protein